MVVEGIGKHPVLSVSAYHQAGRSEQKTQNLVGYGIDPSAT